MGHRREQEKDRTFGYLRVLGLGALVALAMAALFEPGDKGASAAGPTLFGVRRADRFQSRHAAFRGLHPTPMGVLDANGAPMELSFFVAHAPAREVLDYYASDFARGGRHVDRQDAEHQGMASYYDESMGALFAVHAIENLTAKERLTLVFASVVDGPERISLAVDPPDDLPVPEGAVTALRVVEPGAGAATTWTQIAPGRPAQVAAALKERLAAAGWSGEDSRRGSAQVEALQYRRGPTRLSISIAPLQGSEPPESVLAIVREGGR